MIYDLSPRLTKAVDYLPEDSKAVIDVGADHGLLSLTIAKKGIVVYAVENKVGPYRLLTRAIEETGSAAMPILADGFDLMTSDVDTAFILGLGGATIHGILARNPLKLKQLKAIIIEPQSKFEMPISFLLNHGFVNDAGEFIRERRFYPLLRFVPGESREYTKAERFFGPYPLEHKDPMLKQFVDLHVAQNEKLAASGVITEDYYVFQEASKRWN